MTLAPVAAITGICCPPEAAKPRTSSPFQFLGNQSLGATLPPNSTFPALAFCISFLEYLWLQGPFSLDHLFQNFLLTFR